MTDRAFPAQALETARKYFETNGVTVQAWAAEHGIGPATVYEVLAGRKKCRRGDAHRVAVLLGLKPSPDQQATAAGHAILHSS